MIKTVKISLAVVVGSSILFAGSDMLLCAGDVFTTAATGNYIDDILFLLLDFI